MFEVGDRVEVVGKLLADLVGRKGKVTGVFLSATYPYEVMLDGDMNEQRLLCCEHEVKRAE